MKKITCKYCSKENNWEIKDQNGNILNKHYSSKEKCIKDAKKLANECGCELCICEDTCCK